MTWFSSLEDDLSEIREEIWNLWSEVGKKWVMEEITRDEKLKEQLDFQGSAEPPAHFPNQSKKAFLSSRKKKRLK